MLKLTQQNRRRGFTLVELLIVVIIIAVLAAVAIPRFADSGKRSKESAAKADLKLMRNAIETFRNDVGNNPASLTDLVEANKTLVKAGSAGAVLTAKQQADWKGPYLQSLPEDPTQGTVAGNNKNWTYAATDDTVNATVKSATDATW